MTNAHDFVDGRIEPSMAPGLAPVLTGPELGSPDLAEDAATPQVRLGTSGGGWPRRYRILLAAVDIAMVSLALAFGAVLQLRADATGGAVRFGALLLGFAVGWPIMLQASGAYELKHLGSATEEAKRALRASLLVVGLIAIASYVSHTEFARSYVLATVPTGTVLLLTGRVAVRSHVRRRRRRGEWSQRILAVGTRESVAHLIETVERGNVTGLQIVAGCVEDAAVGDEIAPGVPVVGGVATAAEQSAVVEADVVAVAGAGLGPMGVRELGWRLEGTGRGLVVAPSVTEVAGTRVHLTPVAGLPLVWLDQPQLGRVQRALKRTLDVALGSLILLAVSPLMALTALAITLDSRGPVFFRQDRLGTNGQQFRLIKFRSMRADAEHERAAILELNEQDGGGVLFKIARDPRITRVGRVIRALSIDELPQLVHVLSGRMSLVGPRPLATADSHYTGHARRRLLVRPGLTGLWQVSGRSTTSWEDAVRLDLYYVENWSLTLDVAILLRTVWAVVTRRGAY